jgi:hypothetical protein
MALSPIPSPEVGGTSQIAPLKTLEELAAENQFWIRKRLELFAANILPRITSLLTILRLANRSELMAGAG